MDLEKLMLFSELDKKTTLEMRENNKFREKILNFDKPLENSVKYINANAPAVKLNIKVAYLALYLRTLKNYYYK